jgi:adenylate kinase family enzyme
MHRVVILGPGGSGKSTLGRRLGARVGLPVVELDELFWGPGLEPTPPEHWHTVVDRLAAEADWIIDGDLGPHDVLRPRLERADTVVVLDISLWRCVWRSLMRSRQRRDYWQWLVGWRRRSRPALLAEIAAYTPRTSAVVILRSPRAVERWLMSTAP